MADFPVNEWVIDEGQGLIIQHAVVRQMMVAPTVEGGCCLEIVEGLKSIVRCRLSPEATRHIANQMLAALPAVEPSGA